MDASARSHCADRASHAHVLACMVICQLTLFVAPLARADDDASEFAVTPYRPTLSNPATLPVPGWLEAEFGVLDLRNDDHSRDASAPFLFKYAFDENSGLLFGGNAWLQQRAPGAARVNSFGDVQIEWKQRFVVSEKTAVGFEFGPTLPTAKAALGIGQPAWTLNTILSTDAGATHFDINAGAIYFSQVAAGKAALQTAWAGSASWSLTSALGGALELSGTHQRGALNYSQVLGALNYNVSPLLVFDGGMSYGLHRNGHDVGLFGGMTMRLGKLR